MVLCTHPPFDSVRRGEVLARTDALDGSVSVYTTGTVLVLPGIHQVRRYSIRDQVYRPTESASATGPAPFQSVEGLSIGVDLAVRWTVDRARLAQMSKEFPDDISADLVAPAVQGIVYPTFARYSVREIFSQRRTEIQAGADRGAQAEIHRHGAGAARSRYGEGRSASRLSSRNGEAPLRGTRDRENSLHPAAQGGAGQTAAARGRGRQGAAANGRGSRRPRASHRSARAGGDHEAHPALQAEADRATAARG